MRYSRQHKEATRQRLIDAAADVLRSAGLAGASIERIAAAAGVTHGALYKHFPNKDALLQAALPAAEAEFRAEARTPTALIERYLGAPAGAPPSLFAALAGEMSHASPAARDSFETELRHLLAALEVSGDPAGTGFTRLALLVGGLVLARGVNDPDLAQRAIAACRTTALRLPALLAGEPAAPNRFAGHPDFGALDPLPRRLTPAGPTAIAHIDAGRGRPIVFLNSIAFTSYCWRNVIAHLSRHARCLAPDLPGSGASGPSPAGYRVFAQIDLLEAWLDSLGLHEDVVIVGHEWGATIAFDLARRRPSRIAGIVHLGATLNGTSGMYPSLWAGWHRRLREAGGENLILEDDRMLDRQLNRGTLRRLEPAVTEAYRAMWPSYGPARAPLLRLVQDMPIDGAPADVAALVARDMDFMATSPLPKLFLRVTPGWRRFDPDLPAIRAWPNQTERELPGVLLPMEDVPDQLASAVLGFVEAL
jgi:haloalkane dehalogenase